MLVESSLIWYYGSLGLGRPRCCRKSCGLVAHSTLVFARSSCRRLVVTGALESHTRLSCRFANRASDVLAVGARSGRKESRVLFRLSRSSKASTGSRILERQSQIQANTSRQNNRWDLCRPVLFSLDGRSRGLVGTSSLSVLRSRYGWPSAQIKYQKEGTLRGYLELSRRSRSASLPCRNDWVGARYGMQVTCLRNAVDQPLAA